MKQQFLLFYFFFFLSFLQLQSQTVSVTPFVGGLTHPIDIKNCGDDRLFVAERNGRIRIVNPDGTLRATPFLDITSKISSLNSEEGFLGFCFSPDYKTSGKFYVSYTDSVRPMLISVIEEYKVNPADSNLADPSSSLTIITVQQPFQNHKGGNLMFGPDGFLYISWGDGGSGGDPYNNGQNKTVLLGKILRIDVSNSSQAQPYTIPPSNPFADSTGSIRKEIWAYGLRNPWRDSFDPLTNDLWIADVGQNAREEIDFQPAGDPGGNNYGWHIMEGTACYSPATNCNTTGLKLPIYDYSHAIGTSIIGGFVYRSIQSRDLWGLYLFSDYGGGWIDGLRQLNGAIDGSVIQLSTSPVAGPISFGRDRFNDLYMCLVASTSIYKLRDANSNPFPKAYFTVIPQGNGIYDLQAAEGQNISYQWLYNDTAVAGAISPGYVANQDGVYQLVVTNSVGNKDTSQAFILSPSTVILKDFTGTRISNGRVLLTWKTIAEQNNSGFEIERKLENETEFTGVAFVASLAADGNSITTLNYSYADTPIYKGVIQYRLKQTNTDGSFTYSPVIAISAISLNLAITIDPNPAKNFIRVTTNNKEAYQYQLIDVNGRILLQGVFNGDSYQFYATFAKTGIYFLKVISVKTGEFTVKKVLIDNK